MRLEAACQPKTWRIQVNGRVLATVTVSETGRRRAVETAAMCVPEVCDLIGECTVRSVKLVDDEFVDIRF